MASPFLFLCLFLLLCPFLLTSNSHSISSIDGGFVVSLIHRDSPQSPFCNHSMTLYDRHLAAAYRSISHSNYLHLQATTQSGPPEISSALLPDHLEYIVTYYIGTPPTKVYAFADTGSDLIWTKGPPFFDRSKSFSFTNLSCSSVPCSALSYGRKTCYQKNQICTYELRYADGSRSIGSLSSDKFTFEAPDNNLVDVGFLNFGYSKISSPHFQGLQNGCLGLNRERLSLIHQLGIKKFSHCLVIPDDQGSGSRMYFGSRAAISGDLTPLLKNKDWHYYVTLEGISIGDQRVPIPPGIFNLTGYDVGGAIIDSGTSYTTLRSEGFYPFLVMMRQNVHLPLVRGPSGYFELCFEGTYEDLRSLPFVTFHFSGADVQLMKETTFVEFGKGLWCLAIIRSDNNLSIIGSIQMRNIWVGYDLEREVISFAPADCATF